MSTAIHPAELERKLRAKVDENATIHDMTDDGGYGLVRWSRPDRTHKTGREHIVHRWAIRDTDGRVAWPEGFFYLGSYYGDEDEARQDYRERA